MVKYCLTDNFLHFFWEFRNLPRILNYCTHKLDNSRVIIIYMKITLNLKWHIDPCLKSDFVCNILSLFFSSLDADRGDNFWEHSEYWMTTRKPDISLTVIQCAKCNLSASKEIAEPGSEKILVLFFLRLAFCCLFLSLLSNNFLEKLFCRIFKKKWIESDPSATWILSFREIFLQVGEKNNIFHPSSLSFWHLNDFSNSILGTIQRN